MGVSRGFQKLEGALDPAQCYYGKFGRCRSKPMGVSRGPKNFLGAGSRSFRMGRV